MAESELPEAACLGISTFLAGGGKEAVTTLVQSFYQELLALDEFKELDIDPAKLVPSLSGQIVEALEKVVAAKDASAVGDFSIHANHKQYNLSNVQITTATEVSCRN